METAKFMSTDFLPSFIEMYRQYPCLWKISDPDYSNRILKENAIQDLLDFTRETIPNVDKNFIKNRIQCLRSSFRKENRKVRRSKMSDTSVVNVHIPKLWYYNLLLFTSSSEEGRTSPSNVSLEDELYFDIPQDYSPSTTIEPVQKKKKMSEEAVTQRTIILEKVLNMLNKEDDEFICFGKAYAMKLKAMDASQRLYADKLINDVLYYGQTGQLSSSSVFIPATISETGKLDCNK